jgi:5-deoxy-glucuronate isomerase
MHWYNSEALNKAKFMKLLIKPKKNSQEIASVTPQSAGWRYVSFSAHRLAPGELFTLSDNANELCAVILSGIASAKTDDIEWQEIGGRKSVFEDSAPYAVYAPPRTISQRSGSRVDFISRLTKSPDANTNY